MAEQGAVIEIGKAIWPRHIAVHEAGHAIAAWFFGVYEVEISLSDDRRIAKTFTSGDVDDCRAVAVWRRSTPYKVDEIKPHHLLTDDSRRVLMDHTCKAIIATLAGIVAQSRYTGESIVALKATSGVADMETVRDLIDVYRAAGGDNEDIELTSINRAQALISMKWWDIIALSKILENRAHMPTQYFHAIMGYIDSPMPKMLTLDELDREKEL